MDGFHHHQPHGTKKYICPYQILCGISGCLHNKPHTIPEPSADWYCDKAPCTVTTIQGFPDIKATCIEIEDG